MRARIIAVGERMPGWVAEGFAEYRKRLSHELPLELLELKPGTRGKGRDDARAMHDEGAAILAALPRDTHVVALDGGGRAWSSEALAAQLAQWRMAGRDLAFLIGGPDIPEVKKIIRSTTLEHARQVARRVMSFDSERQVMHFLREETRKLVPEAF
jgi:rRNA large subunit m3Psi methyltransferase RlmH